MNTISQNRLLEMRSAIVEQNQALQRATGRAADSLTTNQAGTPDFAAAIQSALQQVSAQQSRAGAQSEAYDRGETHDIVSVMIERQKASLGFEMTLQVRNKLLSAYRDIMNMPV
ncbi:MAG TPA: flagellar hook-basal body complex protein FliE [Xanthomonadales bacterium]|nr:flagellar hook-basal body complex protein FliE [Xanthomonadales bacterium]